MPGGLAGLAFVPGGYDQTGLQVEQLIANQVKNEGLAALGKSFQTQFLQGQGVPMVQPGAPPPGIGMPGGGAPGGPGAPPPMLSGPPPAGPGAPPPPGAAIPGGGPIPGRPYPPMGGPGPAPAPVFSPPPGAGAPSPAGPGAAGPQFGSMTWQDLARRIVQANPDARPEVIASAVTQAMPLMNADSQAQWRMVNQQLQQERLEFQRRQLEEKTTHDRALEDARTEGLRQGEEKLKLSRERFNALKDDRAQRLAQNAEKMRQQALQFSDKMDAAERTRRSKEWYNAQRAYYDYMRTRINAQANVPNKTDRDEAVRALDDEYRRFLSEHDMFNRGEIGGGGPATPATTTPPAATGGRSAPAAAPVTPAPGSPAARVGGAFGDLGTGNPLRPMNTESANRVKAYIQANPDQRDAVIQELTKQGYVTDGL